MSGNKTVLFIPGFQEDLHFRDYTRTIRAIEQKGYEVVFIPINWVRTTITDWVEELNPIYTKYNPNDTILAGFSYGATTAFMSAVHRNPSELWLFSLSPYFYEDLTSKTFNKAWAKRIGHRRVDSFMKLNFTDLMNRIGTKTLYFYGTEELKQWPDISYRTTAVEKNKHAQTVMINGAKHDVTSDEYLEAIKSHI